MLIQVRLYLGLQRGEKISVFTINRLLPKYCGSNTAVTKAMIRDIMILSPIGNLGRITINLNSYRQIIH